MFKFFQNLGRSLMLPVVALWRAIIVGIGNLLKALSLLPTVSLFFTTVGTKNTRPTRAYLCNWCSNRHG